ncbi:MAG: DNA-processing protein DprA [Gammaproteobacteria bacterium]|jgi:DNA processing protein
MKNNMNKLQLYLALNRLTGLTAGDIKYLSQYDGDLAGFVSSSPALLTNAGFSVKSIQQLKRLDWRLVEDELRWAEAANHHIVTLVDHDYPELLRNINAPPIVLFVHGRLECLKKPQLAMVGSRNPTPVGKEIAFQFAQYLAAAGLVITSGLAMGVDAASHAGALQTGSTIAVVGTGIDQIYPARNRGLAERIIEQGAVVSEFPLYVQAKRNHFPRRNRIISGLSMGTLVVEAAKRSGSLITARCAGEQGREVFAIPGSIHNPLSRGCHKLIREGAKLVEKAQDILEELELYTKIVNRNSFEQCELVTNEKQEVLDEDRRKLLFSIGFETTAVDTLISRTGFTSREISSMLLMLELEGYVKQVPGGYVATSARGAKVETGNCKLEIGNEQN